MTHVPENATICTCGNAATCRRCGGQGWYTPERHQQLKKMDDVCACFKQGLDPRVDRPRCSYGKRHAEVLHAIEKHGADVVQIAEATRLSFDPETDVLVLRSERELTKDKLDALKAQLAAYLNMDEQRVLVLDSGMTLGVLAMPQQVEVPRKAECSPAPAPVGKVRGEGPRPGE